MTGATLGEIKKMPREQNTVRALFTKLIGSPLQIFPDFHKKLNAPDRQGVYVIYDPRGKVAHVGRTPKGKGGVAQRLRNHMSGASSFTHHYLNGDGSKLRGKYKFRCLVVDNRRRRVFLEAYAIGHLCPAYIGLG
ncbi:MAG: hypothetical protein WCF16_13210 [Alphaproteobacteria bacterium]